ncbi:LexA family protein [Brevibacillus ginsengisoli]|uniref:LexA family protein n=1 Tax=Brevibacillus ginsengisoli TaxID=363854 RepID=UPI003CEC2906
MEQKIMQEIAINLKKILIEKGITQKQVSELTGASTSAVSDYINAKTLMAPNIIQLFSEKLGVPASKISSSLAPVDGTNNDPSIIMLPVVGKISCGNGLFAYEDVEGYEPTPKDWLNGGEYFYLRAKGNSMMGARIFEGDLLLIRKQPEVENGEIAAVLIGDEAVLKRVFRNGDTLILQSENSQYPPIICPPADVRILGKLKMNVIKY